MTERERWIVYPLLFLALGAALRDKLFDTTMSRRIVCQELVVVDEGKYPQGRQELVRIGAVEIPTAANRRIGRIEVNGQIDADGYFTQGVPIGGPLRLGISLQDLTRMWEQAARQRQQQAAPPRLEPERPAAPSQAPEGRPEQSEVVPETPRPSPTPEAESSEERETGATQEGETGAESDDQATE